MIVEQNQSIYDVAIQEYGSAEGVFKLMADNPAVINSLNKVLAPGTKLKIVSDAYDADMLKYFKNKTLKPASGADVPPVDESLYILNVDDTPLENVDGSFFTNR